MSGGDAPPRPSSRFLLEPVDASPEVLDAILVASRTHGVDPIFMLSTAWTESRLRPAIRNPGSSASGLFQYTERTWLNALREFGGPHGVAHLAHAANDRSLPQAERSRAYREAVGLRSNARLNAMMAAGHMRMFSDAYRARFRREPRFTDLHVMHMLGDTSGLHFIAVVQREPGRSVSEFLGEDAMDANAGIFRRNGVRGGAALSVGEVYRIMSNIVESRRSRFVALNAENRYFEVADATP